jgi:hypothetical protein
MRSPQQRGESIGNEMSQKTERPGTVLGNRTSGNSRSVQETRFFDSPNSSAYQPNLDESNWPRDLTRSERRHARRVAAKARARLMNSANMEQFLTEQVGAGNWTYDATADVWIIPHRRFAGPGRAHFVIQRGGDWFQAVIPDSASS